MAWSSLQYPLQSSLLSGKSGLCVIVTFLYLFFMLFGGGFIFDFAKIPFKLEIWNNYTIDISKFGSHMIVWKMKKLELYNWCFWFALKLGAFHEPFSPPNCVN